MRRFLLILAVVLFAMTAFAAIAPGLYRVNVNSTLNVRNAPGGAKIGSLSNGDLVQVTVQSGCSRCSSPAGNRCRRPDRPWRSMYGAALRQW